MPTMASMLQTARISSGTHLLEVGGTHHRAAESCSSAQVMVRANAFVGLRFRSGLRCSGRRKEQKQQRRTCGGFEVRAAGNVVGQDPEWSEDDYIVLGLAHCFQKDENGKLKDAFLVEPVTAGTLECMENGGVTCYKHVTATNLGVALKEDVSLLPKEFHTGSICDEFDFRAKCASRTWKRDHPQENLLHLVPKDGVRSDYNFSLQDKRVLNVEVVVNDSDNIKQDMSIDVYGRKKEEEIQNEISELYSV